MFFLSRMNKREVQIRLKKWHDRVTTCTCTQIYFMHLFTFDGTHLYESCSAVSLFTPELKIKENNII